MQVIGTFDTKKFYDTLAMLLSKQFNCTIIAHIITENEQEENQRGA